MKLVSLARMLAAANLREPAQWIAILRTRPVSAVSEVLAVLALYDADVHRPMIEDQRISLDIAYRMALTEMLTGAGSMDAWEVCVCSLNIAMVLCEWGYGREYLPDVITALQGAYRAKVRADRTGKWGFDGPAIQAIKNALDIHEAQLLYATKEVTSEAMREVRRRKSEGNSYQEAA